MKNRLNFTCIITMIRVKCNASYNKYALNHQFYIFSRIFKLNNNYSKYDFLKNSKWFNSFKRGVCFIFIIIQFFRKNVSMC